MNIEEEQPNRIEKEREVDWLEVRRNTMRDLVPVINELIYDLTRIEEERLEGKKHTIEQTTLRKVYNRIIKSQHLTVGDESCCNEAHGDVGRNLPGYSSVKRGMIVEYEKGMYQVAYPHDEPEEYAWVLVTHPFIADNLTREVLQHAEVRPAHKEEVEKQIEIVDEFGYRYK